MTTEGSGRRALIIVDMQEGFLNERNRWIVPNIQEAVRTGGYALIIEATFHAESGSLWDTQVNWTFALSPTIPEIKGILPPDTLSIIKTAKSAFKGDKDLAAALRAAAIDEVHVVGVDTEDCVYATAQESFDLGFPTYILENCTESSVSADLRLAALQIMRAVRMVK